MKSGPTARRHGTVRALVMALGIAAVTGGVTALPAHAEDGDRHHGHGHGGHEREWRERDWRWHHPYGYVYPGYPGYAYGYVPPPVYYYAPPPVYYAPPPVYYPPPAGVNLLFHFH
jgi:hypothetical protein